MTSHIAALPMGLSRFTEAIPTLLVVEEDAAVRTFLDVALTGNQFNVLLASSGDEALRIYRHHDGRIDLVLMDVNMPGLTGPETLAQLQKIDARVSCCFMSGDTSLEFWPDLVALGARRILTKPFSSVRDLARTLRQIIDETSGG